MASQEQEPVISHFINELRRNAEGNPNLARQVSRYLDTPEGFQELRRRFAIMATIAYLGAMPESQSPITEEGYLDFCTTSIFQQNPELRGTEREQEVRGEQLTFLKVAVEQGYVVNENNEYRLRELGQSTYSEMKKLEQDPQN